MQQKYILPILSGVGLAILSSAAMAQTPTPTPVAFQKIKSASPASVKNNRQVTIASAIERSYKKVVSSSWEQLPGYCYTFDSKGNRVLDIGPDRPVRWADFSEGFYSIQCLRNTDNSINVQCAALWANEVSATAPAHGWFAPPLDNPPSDSGTIYYNPSAIGYLNFVAYTQGIVQPSYSWTWSGGTLLNTSPVQTDDATYKTSKYAFPAFLSSSDSHNGGVEQRFYGLLLGTNQNGSDLIGSTTIRSSVIGMDPSESSFPVKNRYDISWHRPVDNRRVVWNENKTAANRNKLQDGTELEPEIILLTTNSGDFEIPMGLKFGPFPDLTQETRFNYGKAAFIAGSTTTIITSGVGIGTYLVTGSALATPVTATMAIIAAGLSLTGTILGSSPPLPTLDATEAPTSYTAYKEAVKQQKQYGNHTFGTKAPRFIGIVDDALADSAPFEDSDVHHKTVIINGVPTEIEDNTAAHAVVSGNVVFELDATRIEMEQYDTHGYVGETDTYEIIRRSPKFEMTFRDTRYNPNSTQ